MGNITIYDGENSVGRERAKSKLEINIEYVINVIKESEGGRIKPSGLIIGTRVYPQEKGLAEETLGLREVEEAIAKAETRGLIVKVNYHIIGDVYELLGVED